MTAAIWVLSVLLIAEFVFAPVNLWTGRTMGNYTRFTGLPPWFATRILAPLKLATAALLMAGLAIGALSIAGAALALTVSCFYLVRLAQPQRRDPPGWPGSPSSARSPAPCSPCASPPENGRNQHVIH